MYDPDRIRLLFGPYRQPRLKRGDRAACLLRDCEVIVTGWTDGPICWPRCRPVGVPRSQPPLLVDAELARAIRHESAAALRYWWGVSVGVVARWRRAFGIGRAGTPGSAQLGRAAVQAGADAMKVTEWTDEEMDGKSRIAIRHDFGAHLPKGYHGPRWTAEELALLGTAPDEEVASRIGRAKEAVRLMWTRWGIATAHDRRVLPRALRQVED
jgi:hypothetical protein